MTLTEEKIESPTVYNKCREKSLKSRLFWQAHFQCYFLTHAERWACVLGKILNNQLLIMQIKINFVLFKSPYSCLGHCALEITFSHAHIIWHISIVCKRCVLEKNCWTPLLKQRRMFEPSNFQSVLHFLWNQIFCLEWGIKCYLGIWSLTQCRFIFQPFTEYHKCVIGWASKKQLGVFKLISKSYGFEYDLPSCTYLKFCKTGSNHKLVRNVFISPLGWS